jgi:hypothetical protein
MRWDGAAALRDLPVDRLKIDRSFVTDITSDDDARAIVASTIAMGHALGLDLVAEGVEDEATAVVLREMRCDSAQGSHFAHPQPADELSAWLRTRLTAPAAQAAFSLTGRGRLRCVAVSAGDALIGAELHVDGLSVGDGHRLLEVRATGEGDADLPRSRQRIEEESPRLVGAHLGGEVAGGPDQLNVRAFNRSAGPGDAAVQSHPTGVFSMGTPTNEPYSVQEPS